MNLSLQRPEFWVYPRVCGGTAEGEVAGVVLAGLSPRVRGNRHHLADDRHPFRSIPACAGEPAASGSSRASPMVYPRVCGGTRSQPSVKAYGIGLSPRVRGNLPPSVNL